MDFLVGGNLLNLACGIRQVNHPGGILLDDLIALGIGQHGGDHRQILLHGGFLDGLPVGLALAQFHQHVLQSDGPELIQLDAADEGIDLGQHSPVAGNGAGGVLGLPIQPAQGVFLKAHLPIFAVALLDEAFKLLRFMRHVLGDATAPDIVRNRDGFRLGDLSAVGPVAVADGDLELSFAQLFDACHASPHIPKEKSS